MILDYRIFLGFRLDPFFLESLNKISPSVRSLFIHNSDEYLRQIDYAGVSYLGKPLGTIVDLQSLELLEANVYSLLRRLVSDYPYEKYPLILLPIPEDE